MRVYILLLLTLLVLSTLQAQVKLPTLIGDNMVLQRDQPVRIWGWASPGEQVTVRFNNRNYQTTTDADSNWQVMLPATKAGGPYTLNISASNQIHLQDILFGDVWFCSGQSNMVLNMERVKEKYPQEIAAADYPQLRNFFVPTSADVTVLHADLPPGKWQTTSPASVYNFGAAAYFFARQLYNQYHIPIGIINSSVGGTPIEAWISIEGLQSFPEMIQSVEKFKASTLMNRLPAVGNRTPPTVTDKGLLASPKWYEPGYQPKAWKNIIVPGYWADQGVRGLNGVVWYRKEIDLPASMAGIPAKLFLGRIVDADEAYVNGKRVGNITYQYPPRRYDVPADILHEGRNLVVVRVTNNAGKGGFVPDKPYYLSANGQTIDLKGEWQYKVGDVFTPNRNTGGGIIQQQNLPTGLYNTMVAPAIHYGLKGFVWYQGEANTFRPEEYRALLPALIRDWRNKWNNDNLAFLYAQLPNFMDMQYSPSESQWATLRESQLLSLAVPNTAMAVIIDAGEWNDIHPLNKKAVGDRLALAARKLAYGEKNLVASGPIFRSTTVQGNKIRISFSDVGSGLIAKDDDELHYFAIAGADKKFVWGKAVIEGNEVVVWNDDIAAPMYVRYAWADNPDGANLYNREGLPASPFRSDR